MNKKMLVLLMVFAMLLVVPACKKKGAGQMNTEAMLDMVPEGPMLIMSFDFQRFAALNFFDKALKEDWQKNAKAAKDFKDYQEFVQQTGIDLQKDVYAVVAAVYGNFDKENPEVLAVANLKYDEAKLLAVLKEKAVFVGEEPYGGRTLYTLKNDDAGKDKDMRLAFLNKSSILIGSPLHVKKAIDLAAKKGQSVRQTAALMKYVDALDKKSMFWLALGNIPAKMKEAPAGGMMPVDLSKAEAFTAVADFKNKVLSGELRLISKNEAGNKQIVEMLNGLKALGAMGASKEPELGQLLNGIQLGASADAITLSFSLSEELMNNLGDKAKDNAQTKMP
ncbi:MAG TPA: hypothetical protein VLQ89_06995, partial [Candidatus Binatia bacterium]|nr:hypothetical protein [Candidatus Binatia bacterium]